KYVDQAGKTIKTVAPITGNVGDAYATKQEEIPGYKFDRMKDSTPTEGKLGTEELTVTYIYNEIAAPVNVKYVDQTGKAIKTVAPITGNVGDAYATKQEEIPGYKFDRMKDSTPTEGKLGTEELTVTYIYNEIAAPVNVKYVDQAGKAIKT